VDVYLVRHAEDRAASELRFGDEGLSERGVEQARALAVGLRSVPFRRCLVSPLARALETAQWLLEGREISMEIVPSLAEGSAGDLAGLSVAEARERFPQAILAGRSVVARIVATGYTAPGGETREAFVERSGVAAALIRSLLGEEGGPALVVSHGGILNYLLQVLLDLPVRDLVPFGFDNCGVVRLITYRERPGFGPFPMLRFAPLVPPEDPSG
jgi:broad specificity phosphatase PhoE